MQNNPTTHTVVSNWFGDAFTALHPLLQTLHLHGGQLAGKVNIQCGNGIAGWVGRRLAQKLGVPTDVNTATLTVDISHSGDALLWNRTFQTSPCRYRLTCQAISLKNYAFSICCACV